MYVIDSEGICFCNQVVPLLSGFCSTFEVGQRLIDQDFFWQKDDFFCFQIFLKIINLSKT